MIGLVLVSHSATLARGVLELAQQMSQGRVPLAAAGGIDDPSDPIGTDPMRVVTALESIADEADDIIVMMDLGSALMSAEMALEFTPPELSSRVHLCSAPLVEGSLAIVASAAAGASVDVVLNEAKQALVSKAEQLGDKQQPDTTSEPSPAEDEPDARPVTTWQFTVPNALGLHARPIARLMQTLGGFQAEVRLSKDGLAALATSMSQLARLNAKQGDELTVEIRGDDTDHALAALHAFVDDNLGDPVRSSIQADATSSSEDVSLQASPQNGTSSQAEGFLSGLAASPGIAIAPAFWLDVVMPDPAELALAQTDPAERDRLRLAMNQAARDLGSLALSVGGDEAGIFEAQALMLTDPELLQMLDSNLAQGKGTLFAWVLTINELAAGYDGLENDYLRARASDVYDIGIRVLRLMDASVLRPPLPTQPVIVLARELTPSQTVQLDTSLVRGIVTEAGSTTSHSAILARSLGIPAVVGVGDGLQAAVNKADVALDGDRGQVWLSLTETVRDGLEQAASTWQASKDAELAASLAPAVTTDDTEIAIHANIASSYEATKSAQQGAHGVGLFRSEFLFMDRTKAPSEAEQYDAYAAAIHAFDANFEDAPITIRTLDVGGDKPLDYLKIPTEDNPFLGWRGLRYCLETPDLFKTQLRALCRASALGNVQVMFPMVSTPSEVRKAMSMVREVQTDLARENIPFNPNMPLGVMIEVPAAVWHMTEIAELVDFVSIGTNDLCQYIMAADRGNTRVASLADPFDPAVLRAIAHTADAAHAAGIKISMCGEMAGDPDATALLIGLGIDTLSMSTPRIAKVKAVIRELEMAQVKQLATEVLELPSAAEVREHIQQAAVTTS
ncbi:MAG: phosphoenolpyruvate--protein phosphotransferase [Deinococcota bacterium]